MEILINWLGSTDIKGYQNNDILTGGPIVEILGEFKNRFSRVIILNDYKIEKINILTAQINETLENYNLKYTEFLKSIAKDEIELINVNLTSPIDFRSIYICLKAVIDNIEDKLKTNSTIISYSFNISSGTPAMSAVMILLGKALGNVKFIQAAKEFKPYAKYVDIPFDIYADLIPDIIRKRNIIFSEEKILNKTFEDIITNDKNFKETLKLADFIAKDDCSILIYGETGTGKELIARAIHLSSLRSNKNFVPINCGAIPRELLESELFGYVKGAFTGANTDKDGLLHKANGGTLFLDEIGDMPLELQVKLLRVIQEKEYRKIGSTETKKIDIRIISATNKDLISEISKGNFREDLLFRINNFILKIPPLRERNKTDIQKLTDYFLARLISSTENTFKPKNITPAARTILSKQSWFGNVRELESTIKRAFLYANYYAKEIDNEIIDISVSNTTNTSISRETKFTDIVFTEDFNLNNYLEEIKINFIKNALIECNGNQTKAAKTLGLKSQQVVNHMIKKYRIEY